MSEEIKEEVIVVEPKVEVTDESRILLQEMSSEIGDLAGALAKAQGTMTNGSKDKQGYGYKYMELGSIIDIARPALSANELSIIQSHELNRLARKPSVITHTLLMHSSGQWIKSSIDIPIHEMKQLSVAQMIGVCMTYGRRYSIQALLMIAADEDTDATKK